MMDIRCLDEHAAVSPQIEADDMPAIAAAGFVTIVNNRPDGEEFGQPLAVDLRTAAEAVGLAWHDIPVGADGYTPHNMNAMRMVLRDAGPVLAFCRSGTRSCNLWAIARAAEGDSVAAVVAKAYDAGWDLRPLAPTLRQLSAVP